MLRSPVRSQALGGASGAAITISNRMVAEGTTGAVAQLSAGLAGALTFSKTASPTAATVTVSSSGQVSISSALTPGGTVTFGARVQNAAGDAIEKRFTLEGFAIPVAPTVTSPGALSGTRGNGQTITGTAATSTPVLTPAYQWQVFTSGAWADISGETGQNYVDTALTAPLQIRRRVTFTNSVSTVQGFTNVLDPAPFDGIPGDKLVYLSSNTWLDTVTTGQPVATLNDYQAGATYAVRLIAQANRPTPATDALTISSGAVRAGAGYASLHPGAYICEIENVTTGFFTHILVRILSNKAANYTATTPAELTTHLNTIQGLINSQGAAFPGAIIDIAPGDYGDFTVSQVVKNNQVNPVVLRSASTDRVNGARPRFQRITLTNTRYVTLQSLWWESYGVAYGSLPLSPMIRGTGGSGLSNDFTTVLNPRAKGGMLEWNGSGLSRVNPALDVNPADQYSPVHTCLKGQWNGTSLTFTRLDLYVGHTATEQNGAALGVWQAAAVPAYVGPNTPDGTARVFTRTDMAPVVRRASDNAVMAMPADFNAEFEVAYLTSTPVATVNGGVQSKPVDGPDGNYIVAWRLVSGGTWTGANTSQLRELNMGWVNQATYENLPTFMAQEADGPYRHLQVDSGNFREIEDVFRLKLMNVDHSFWLADNQADCIARDFIQVFWNVETSGDFRIWGPDHGLFTLFNRMGRPIVRESDWKQMHGDAEQHAADWNGTSSSTHIQTHTLRIGALLSARDGRLGAGFQGPPFASDMFRSASGYRDVYSGCFVDAAETNAWNSANNSVEQGAYTSIITRFGAANNNFPTDPQWPVSVSRQKCTYGSRGSLTGVNASQQYLDDVSSAGNGSNVWLAPDFSHSMDYATLRARFTAVGANAGNGAFANRATGIDQERRAWNPNQWEFRLLLPPTIGQPVSTLVPSPPRQLLFGTKPLTVAVTDGQWSKGATRAAALAATPTSAPGTLSRGEWIVLWQTTSAAMDTPTTMTATIGGIDSAWTARTEALFPFPGNGNLGNIVTETYVSPGTSALTWTPFTGRNIPAGHMAVVVHGSDGSATATPSGNVPWEANSTINASLSHRGSIFSWFNDTGADVAADLTVTFSAVEQGSCILYIIPVVTPGNRLRIVSSASVIGSTDQPDRGAYNSGVSRNYLWGLAFVTDGNAVSVTAAPTGYSAPVNRQGANTAGASIGGMLRFANPAPAASEDPAAATLSAAALTLCLFFGVYESAI